MAHTNRGLLALCWLDPFSWVLAGALLLAAGPGTSPLNAQREWVVKGSLTGIAGGWPGAVVAVPVLRIGTIAGDRGAFTLRGVATAGCYEAIIRTQQRHVTHLRFLAPDSGTASVGDVQIASLPYVETFGAPLPEQHDTVGLCRPTRVSDDLSWPAAHATVSGRLLRGTRALAQVPLDLSCHPRGSIRTLTDSTGAFRFTYQLLFPDNLMLAAGSVALCRLWIATVTMDGEYSFQVQFGSPAEPAPVTATTWALPEPDLRPRAAIGRVEARNAPLRLNGTISFSPGVFPAPQLVGLELTELPRHITFRAAGYPDRPSPSFEVLPVALRVTTGHQLPTTGSDFIFAVPEAYARRVSAGERLEAWVRVPPHYNRGPDTFMPVGTNFWPPLQTASFTLAAAVFDDSRTPDHSFEAMVIWTLHRR